MTLLEIFAARLGPYIGIDTTSFTAQEDFTRGRVVRAENGTARGVPWRWGNAGIAQDVRQGQVARVALFDSTLTTDAAWAAEQARRTMLRNAFVAAGLTVAVYNALRTSEHEELRESAANIKEIVT